MLPRRGKRRLKCMTSQTFPAPKSPGRKASSRKYVAVSNLRLKRADLKGIVGGRRSVRSEK
jgi:hypothetical protein